MVTTPSEERSLSIDRTAVAVTGAAGVAVYGGVAVARGAGAPLTVIWAAVVGGAAVLGVGMALAPKVGGRAALLTVLAAGAAFRLVFVPLHPLTSDDLYRYLWDGRVQAAGISPYAHPPAAPELAGLRDPEVWPRINRSQAPTIYPALTQRVFWLSHLLGVRTVPAWKLLVVVLDVAACALLARALAASGRNPNLVVAYAWNPLPILSFGDAGHVDAVVVLALAGAVLAWRAGRSGPLAVLLGVAAGVKLYPLAVLPGFARGPSGRWSTRRALGLGALTVAVALAAYLPFLLAGDDVLGYTRTYLRVESYESGRRFVLLRALGLDGRLFAGPILGVVTIAALRARRPAPVRAAWLLGAVIVLTLHYPWYATPLVALAVAGGAGWAWPWLGVALQAAYTGLTHPLAPFPDGRTIRLVAGAAVVTLLVLAVRSPRARRAVVFQEIR